VLLGHPVEGLGGRSNAARLTDERSSNEPRRDRREDARRIHRDTVRAMYPAATTRRAALFDMDGTLIAGDSSWLYLRWLRTRGEATLAEQVRALGWFTQYQLGVLDADRMAARALSRFARADESGVERRHRVCHRAQIRPRIFAEARAAVARHRAAGDVLAIVTASLAYAARPLAEDLGIDHVVSTELEVRGGQLTGQPHAPLCYGEGKLVRARRFLHAEGVALTDATFYTDSVTDLPLLQAVGAAVAVNPDLRLRSHARRHGWPILAWRARGR
jgi:HAD superfamily hydrolase (TIGR01490 family)